MRDDVTTNASPDQEVISAKQAAQLFAILNGLKNYYSVIIPTINIEGMEQSQSIPTETLKVIIDKCNEQNTAKIDEIVTQIR